MISIKTQNFESIEFKKYNLAQIILFRCDDIKDIKIENSKYSFFEQLKWYLCTFKESILIVNDILKDCSKIEYSCKE